VMIIHILKVSSLTFMYTSGSI